MTNNVRAVQGLCVKSATLTSKKNQVKLALEADKDDIRAGTGTIADVLISLEFHSTGADSSPVSVSLQGTSFEFQVVNFKVSQDKLNVILVTSDDESVATVGENEEGVDPVNDTSVNGQILNAISLHAADNTPVEVVMAAGADVDGL